MWSQYIWDKYFFKCGVGEDGKRVRQELFLKCGVTRRKPAKSGLKNYFRSEDSFTYVPLPLLYQATHEWISARCIQANTRNQSNCSCICGSVYEQVAGVFRGARASAGRTLNARMKLIKLVHKYLLYMHWFDVQVTAMVLGTDEPELYVNRLLFVLCLRVLRLIACMLAEVEEWASLWLPTPPHGNLERQICL